MVLQSDPQGRFPKNGQCITEGAVSKRLLPQAHASIELINDWGFEFSDAALLLNDVGFYLYQRGRYTGVEPLYRHALASREKALGPEHPEVAQSLNNLATLYPLKEAKMLSEEHKVVLLVVIGRRRKKGLG